jgi:hypothetical protein
MEYCTVMDLSMTPIGRVRARRATPDDDRWGGSTADIELDARTEE